VVVANFCTILDNEVNHEAHQSEKPSPAEIQTQYCLHTKQKRWIWDSTTFGAMELLKPVSANSAGLVTIHLSCNEVYGSPKWFCNYTPLIPELRHTSMQRTLHRSDSLLLVVAKIYYTPHSITREWLTLVVAKIYYTTHSITQEWLTPGCRENILHNALHYTGVTRSFWLSRKYTTQRTPLHRSVSLLLVVAKIYYTTHSIIQQWLTLFQVVV
jgi:hypothetical protein